MSAIPASRPLEVARSPVCMASEPDDQCVHDALPFRRSLGSASFIIAGTARWVSRVCTASTVVVNHRDVRG